MKKIKFSDLHHMNWKKAVIVFKQHPQWEQEFNETQRSYEIKSDAKYFDVSMNGSSLYGNCLDGMDKNVRLDHYMYGSNGKDGWKVEFVYIVE